MADRLLAFYGDDFTGSTDVLESLSGRGIPTVLFTRLPDEATAARFADCRAVGLAGTSRSRSPEWMDAELPRVFEWLRSLSAGIVHYKVCSTFDSAPNRGSIGRALEIARTAFGQDLVPIVVGAPELGRYTVFGQLFASYMGEVHRIDRHPVMSRHPATPMGEADLLIHLGRQTQMPLGRIDLGEIVAGREAAAMAAARSSGKHGVLIDVYDRSSQLCAGRMLAAELDSSGPVVFGSSGVEYALLRAWGMSDAKAELEPLSPVEQTAVVSGSCSPVTETQIRTALQQGFTSIALDYAALATGTGAQQAYETALERGRSVLRAGGSPIFHTALGPDTVVAANPAADSAVADDRAGGALGKLLDTVTGEFSLGRVAVAGGDTSSHALSGLGIFALTLRYPIDASPGSPVCVGHREGRPTGSVEIVLKGGQIGNADYLVRLRDGTL